MKDIIKNKKIIYGVLVLIVLIGIVMTATLKLNVSLMYSDNVRIKVYLEKDYNMDDIKNISEEVFETKDIAYQEIEFFKEAVSITVRDASDEQIQTLTNKLQEKYEIEDTEGLVQTSKVAHLRLSDIVKPYIVPLVIATIISVVYIAIRYRKIGMLKAIVTFLLRTVLAEALLLSIVAIARIQVGELLMPVAIGIYLLVIIFTTIEFQKQNEKLRIEESRK